MLGNNLQEWEEYDARLLGDSPTEQNTLGTHGSKGEILPTSVGRPGGLEGPFLLGAAGEIAAERLTASVGRNGVNRPDDVRLVQRLINSKLPIPLAPLSENGICGRTTIFAIETYQQRVLGMNPPDGRVDPGGVTFRSLVGGGIAPQRPTSSPSTTPQLSGASTRTVAAPSNMRHAAWRYLLEFTKKHEGAVFHMYNNRPANSSRQDVTCGVGFRLDPRAAVTQSWVKNMFFDPATNQTPSDDQMFADWDAAAELARTANNLKQYAVVCHMRMYPDRVYDQMALILRDQKLPALLKNFPDDFKDFANFPAAAQVFCVSFAYGRVPFDFPKLRAAIRDFRWADASKECTLHGASHLKNQAHAELLLLAQRVVDQNLDPDTLPPLAGTALREFETELQAETLTGPEQEESRVDEAGVKARRADSSEFDAYASIRPALLPEHASLAADQLAVIVGRRPTLLALHEMLSSPQPRMAALAVLLGGEGRRSMTLNGSEVPIPSYLRLLSRFCREAAEQMEKDRAMATPSVDSHNESGEKRFGLGGEPRELPLTGETWIAAEHPFVPKTFEMQVAVEGQVPALAAAPHPRHLSKDAFFEDEWASTPTPVPNPRHVHFSRFTTLTATSATEQTILTTKPNPLDLRVTSTLTQPEVIPKSRPTSPGELYWIYVPDAYKKAVNDAVAARKTPPMARVSVLFGVGLEVNRHGLRSFFANKSDCILIEVGGVESVPEATGPWGIGITDAMIADLLSQALGATVTSQVEVVAAYSTGYRGINGTVNNTLIDLTHIRKMIYFDCLYRGDGPRAPSGAVMPPKRHHEAPAKSAFNTWRAIQTVLTASPTCEIIIYDITPGGTPTYSDGARKVEISGATFIELKPLNVELKALILTRLMDNGIKDGYFTDAKVPAGIRALIPLLPTRGTLSSAVSSTTPRTIGKWAKDNSVKIAHAVKGFATAMELARTHRLMGWATPPTEFGHDGFLPEFGWEHLAG